MSKHNLPEPMEAFETIKDAITNQFCFIPELNVVEAACKKDTLTLPKDNKCSYCGSIVNESDNYCSNCGRKLKQC